MIDWLDVASLAVDAAQFVPDLLEIEEYWKQYGFATEQARLHVRCIARWNNAGQGLSIGFSQGRRSKAKCYRLAMNI
jgi:hypothetical protein